MKQWIKIAYRNTVRQKKRSFLLGGAIAFGFLVITLLNGFTAGLLVTVKSNFSNLFGGHIYVSGARVNERGVEINEMSDPAALTESLAVLGASFKSANRRSKAFGDLIFGSKELRQRIEGVDFTDEKGFLEAFTLDAGGNGLDIFKEKNALILPVETALRLNIKVGETVLYRCRTVTGQQNVAEFTVAATMSGQSSLGLSSAYAHLSTLNRLIGLPEGSFQTYNITLADIEKIDRAAELLYGELSGRALVEERKTEAESAAGDPASGMQKSMMRIMAFPTVKTIAPQDRWQGTRYSILTLNDMTEQIISMVEILNMVSLAIFLILLAITMVGVMNSFRMIMIERTGEIGTMRAMGAQKGNIRNVFLLEALFIAAGGAATGYLAALAVSLALGSFNLGTAGVLEFFLNKGFLNLSISLFEVLKTFFILAVASVFASYLPARAASGLKPAAALRTAY